MTNLKCDPQKVCAICNSSKSVLRHHISYIPEVIEYLCRACHGKKIRRKDARVLKAYPQRGILLIPKRTLLSFGDSLGVEYAHAVPVAVIYNSNLSLNYVRDALSTIILRKIKLKLKLNSQESTDAISD